MNTIYNIGIAGNIGVGKTTLTEKLSKDLQLEPIYESVIDNPYLLDFYDNMSRWSFNLQMYFLYTRFSLHLSRMERLYPDLLQLYQYVLFPIFSFQFWPVIFVLRINNNT